MPSSALRQFTIVLLAIVTIVAHPASGFSVDRTTKAEVDTESSADLVTQETVQVTNLKNPNDLEKGEDAATNKDTKEKNKFIGEEKITDSTERTFTDAVRTETGAPVGDISGTDVIINNSSNIPTIGSLATETTISYSYSLPITGIKETSTERTIQPLTTNKPTSTESKIQPKTDNKVATIERLIKPASSDKQTPTESQIRSITSTKQNLTENTQPITKTSTEIRIEPIDATSDNLKSTERTITSTEYVTTADNSPDLSGSSTNIDNIYITGEPLQVLTENLAVTTIGSSKINTDINNTIYTSNKNDKIELRVDSQTTDNLNKSFTHSNSNFTTDNINKADFETKYIQGTSTDSLGLTTIIILSTDTSKLQNVIPESQAYTDDVPETTLRETALNQITKEPSHEMYPTTDGARVISLEEASLSTKLYTDMVKSESIQTTLPIPSLERMREKLTYEGNQPSAVRDLGLVTETMPSPESIESTQPGTLSTVVSRRAGFLDFSKKTAKYDESSTDSSASEMEAANIELEGQKKMNAYESQRLAEDAMREEELLKYGVTGTKTFKDEKAQTNHQTESTEGEATKSQHATEDTLSVKPINQDSRRTTLYTVGPNYKPMKRIEVQPAKPFVRDPDDNSWRNESISSLGIVFKPKNSSSKSFKEVLKTKTEIELNNLQDKDSKENAPELRVRLEKITEVRKKKKKIDKFGEEVYSDYEEEGSAEGNSSPKASATTATSSSGTETKSNTEIESTSPMTTTKGYWTDQLEAINKQEILKDLGLDMLTTQKAKKPYNLAEYYDTTDDYDADYITLPNIDLKKFTTPLDTTAPLKDMHPPSTSSRPMSSASAAYKTPQFPERKPTVQYFPPTTKPPKVVLNEYDFDFEKRIRAYTQQTTKTAPNRAEHAATTPTAGDRLRMRPTVRPADFTTTAPPRHLVISEPGLERGSFVIRHLGEFLSHAAELEEEARAPEFPAFTRPPAPVTTDGVAARFVDTFNRESERFKVEFPVLFNSSVVHREADGGAPLAASSAFMKRLYGSELGPRDCGARAGCALAVDLSPAYELHYYVPDQEESEPADGPPRPAY